jgi:hypothetical protein
MAAIISMLDQLLVRVNCKTCGPTEFKVGHLLGKAAVTCEACGGDMPLDQEPLKSHLAMLVDSAAQVDARRKRSGYVVRRPLSLSKLPVT